jgi:hypothetical protein
VTGIGAGPVSEGQNTARFQSFENLGKPDSRFAEPAIWGPGWGSGAIHSPAASDIRKHGRGAEVGYAARTT